MIVGCKNIPYDKLHSCASDVKRLEAFAESLVPRVLRHNKKIVDNQKYLVAVTLRKMKSIPFYTRQELSNKLVDGISISGVINVIYDLEDILSRIDEEKLSEVLKNDEARGGV